MPRRKQIKPDVPTPTESTTQIQARLLEAGIPTSVWPKVSNVVGTFDTCVQLDLKLAAQHVRNISYNPRRFNGAVLRLRTPVRCTAMVFRTGRVVVMGTRSVADSMLAGRKVVRDLCKLGYAARMEGYRVSNVVAAASAFGSAENGGAGNAKTLERPLRLEGVEVHPTFGGRTVWVPELFPGLCYAHNEPSLTVVVFSTGKILFVGARHEEHVLQAFEQIYPALEQCVVKSN